MREDLFSANVGYENGKGSHDIILCVKKRNSSRASESFDKTFKMLLLYERCPGSINLLGRFADLVSDFAFS